MSGKQLFYGPAGCNDCHISGTAGAPILSDRRGWERRLELRSRHELFVNTMRGYGLMGPKGNCDECDSIDIKKIIDYILLENQIK